MAAAFFVSLRGTKQSHEMSIIVHREPLLSFAEKKVIKKAADFKNCLKVGCCLDCASPRLCCRAKEYYPPISLLNQGRHSDGRRNLLMLLRLLHFAPVLQFVVTGFVEQVEHSCYCGYNA